LGAIAVAPLVPEYLGFGNLSGLCGAAFLSLIAVIAGARGVRGQVVEKCLLRMEIT
jgi:hypothetical protein